MAGQQLEYTCVATSLQMMLEDLGHSVPVDDLVKLLKTTENGAKIKDILSVLKKLKLEKVITATYETEIDLLSLSEKLAKGEKAIVSVKLGNEGAHALIIDSISEGRVFMRDPLPLGWGSSYSVTVAEFKNFFNKKCIIFK